MITDTQKMQLGELAAKALDKIESHYDPDRSVITAAVLAFEICEQVDEDKVVWHAEYVDLPTSSPHHSGGLMRTVSNFLFSPGETREE